MSMLTACLVRARCMDGDISFPTFANIAENKILKKQDSPPGNKDYNNVFRFLIDGL